MAKKIFWFVMFSVWIVFLSLTANVFYSPSTFAQSDAAHKCRRITGQNHTGNVLGTYFHKSGAGLDVLIERDSQPYTTSCRFNNDMDLLFSVK